MYKENSESQPLIKKALNKMRSMIYPQKKFSILKEDPQININGIDYHLASFNRRFFAAGLDMIIIAILIIPFSKLISYFTMDESKITQLKFNPELMLNDASPTLVLETIINSGLLYNIIMTQLCIFVLVMLYVMIFWLTKSATPGKIILKCKIIGINQEKISFKQALIRCISIVLPILPLMMGFFMIDWTKKTSISTR